MNFLNRAWKNVTRRLSKSVLLLLTFFVIGNLVIVGLGISSAADNAKVLTRKQMKAIVSYEVDYDAFQKYVDSLESDVDREEAYNNYPSITVDSVKNIADDKRIKAINFQANNIGYSHGFENVPVGNEDSNNGNAGIIMDDGSSVQYVQPNVTISSNVFPDMIELEDGTYSIVSGSFYTQDDIDENNAVCLITQELADQNNLSIGDTISFGFTEKNQVQQIIDAGVAQESDMYAEFTIKGIYTTTQDVDPNSDFYKYMSPYESPKNIILVPQTTLAQVAYDMSMINYNYAKSTGEDISYLTEPTLESASSVYRAIFLLEDPLEVDDFVSDHTADLAEYTKLNANNDTFKELARPLDTLSFFGNLIVGIVVINAVIIISLVTALTLKTREFEIGVLLSMGVSKFKVVLQLFMELLIVAVVGFTLAVGSGMLIAGKVGDAVLDYQQSQDDTTIGSDNNYFYDTNSSYFTEVTQEDLLSKYNVTVSWQIILTIYVMGIIVVFVAIVIPSAMIMRLNPKQILLQ